jgi:Cd2+/Zn2+-exporting ATPase
MTADEADADGPRQASDEDAAGAGPETLRLSVPDMDCPSCAGKVENRLERVEGVIETALQPTTRTARVTFDPAVTTPGDVTAAIEAAGYDVDGSVDDAAPETAEADVDSPMAVWTSTRAMRTWLGAVLLTAGLTLEFLLPGVNGHLGTVLGRSIAVGDGLLVAAILGSGLPVVRAGYYSARARSLDMDLLMATAILAATGIGYFVEAATLAVLFSIAELLEDYAMDRARDSLRELVALSPEEATVLRDGEEVTVPAATVEVGERVAVRPGEKVPLDGRVVEGGSAVDESPITGESVPVDKTPGDDVFAGTIAEEGYLEVEVTSPASESTLARIIDMVRRAEEERTESEQFVDRFAGYYTPVVVAFALLTAALPPLLIDGSVTLSVAGLSHTATGAWETWFVRGLTLLVIACPCAFVISTPVSVVSGITSAARNGVLIKGGRYLEAMGEVDVVAIDKTGTLTKGELAVTDVRAVGDADETTVFRRAAAVERGSEHPIAGAIRDRAAAAGVEDPPAPTDFESLPGKGVSATVDGETHYVGKPALFADLGVDLDRPLAATDGGQATETVGTDGADTAAGVDPDAPDRADEPRTLHDLLSGLEAEGKTVVLVGTATAVHGVVAIADQVRPESAAAVDRLRSLGVERVVMLTGDNDGTARAIADTVGVDEYRAELLPDEKAEVVEEIQADGASVAMVGDGINDAPALATADVGISMGAAGTDTAIETSDVALMGDDVGNLPYLYALSRKANGVIRENVWASLAVKALLAVGVPLGYVSVALAVVVGDMGMSLGVTGNAMRLANLTPDRILGDEG